MTGYASKGFEYRGFHILIEIKSLNNKFLDVRFRLPSSLGFGNSGMVHPPGSAPSSGRASSGGGPSSHEGAPYPRKTITPGSLEWRLRKIIKQHINRGKIDVFISLTAEEDHEFTVIKSMIDRYYGIIKKIEDETSINIQISLYEILLMKNLLNPHEDIVRTDIPGEVIEDMFVETLTAFQESRRLEGEDTKDDIFGCIEKIKKSLKKIEKEYPPIVEKYKKQLKEKIKDLVDEKLDESRLAIEAGIYASKVDVSEEISRINGHTEKILRTMKTDGSCGRELDFITQEINREINTIGSKVPDFGVAENVITVKTYLERIREQVRNIE
jgi:uncharacterized protein (TIGR00255 family)